MKTKFKKDGADASPAKKMKAEKPEKPAPEKKPPKLVKKTNGKPTKKPLKPPYDKLKSKKMVNSKGQPLEKPADWNEFKKVKKELREKRRTKKPTRSLIDIITKAKQIGEKLRIKELDGGNSERSVLVNELHSILGNQGNYVKFVLTHDMARIVQHMLKFGPLIVREEISKELIPSTVLMLKSKYGKFVVKNMLKYGNGEIRANTLQACYGHAVKLTSHAVSAPIFEFAYSMYASPQDKVNLIQEFFGDMYKQTKDVKVKHLRDVYRDSETMKVAALGATKSNLQSILNKELLDSTLVHTVLSQFVTECSSDDKAELLSQLSSHFAVLCNSKDGAKVAMQCIWHGTNKDRKACVKALKEHIVELSKHEHGHCAVIALLDAIDDTVLLNKALLSEILDKADELIADDWGRKVLNWIINPADRINFHPVFKKGLEAGRRTSNVKKECEVRRKEILSYCLKPLLEKISENGQIWFQDGKRCIVVLAILKLGIQNDKENTQKALECLSKLIVDPEWKVDNVCGIEDPGIHMFLKKLAQNDKELNEGTFGEAFVSELNKDNVKNFIQFNRGCFVLINVFENNGKLVQDQLRSVLKPHKAALRKSTFVGAKILHDLIFPK